MVVRTSLLLLGVSLITACSGYHSAPGRSAGGIRGDLRPLPKTNIEQEAVLATRVRGGSNTQQTCLYISEYFLKYNEPAMCLEPDSALVANQAQDDTGEFRKLALAATFESYKLTEAQPFGEVITNANVRLGDKWHLIKADSNSQYEVIFEILDYQVGGNLKIKYVVKNFEYAKSTK